MMNKAKRIPTDRGTEAPENLQESQAGLLEGYRQMAADVEQELEAEEWVEGLIHDAW